MKKKNDEFDNGENNNNNEVQLNDNKRKIRSTKNTNVITRSQKLKKENLIKSLNLNLFKY
jgi:hypothetical protein